MLLEEIMKFESGTLLTRIENEPQGNLYSIYENEQFYMDDSVTLDEIKIKYIQTMKKIQQIETNDIIINLFKGDCTKVRDEFSGYVINANFVKVSPKNNEQLNPDFFLYWFNESEESKKQLLQSVQGSVMKKISIAKLKKMDISLPSREKQEIIGQLYHSQKTASNLHKKKIRLTELLTKEKIKRFEREEL
ncbi:restriction endonuclease subunit S [Candidatus Enterococcus ikei]|uniref:Restriction endonuclease subunit S n=1 Tax=Candidatus Enterococcus ikei TaxID=2815326 RepID=A0ABS3GWI4_9ENTE|nr:restriction endonuclease subunit S [Enterococcus sp. DIV0869a]MBO0439617.1 restriction endonuclease subunit S [Enterococcus sp. DIV0869a]